MKLSWYSKEPKIFGLQVQVQILPKAPSHLENEGLLVGIPDQKMESWLVNQP